MQSIAQPPNWWSFRLITASSRPGVVRRIRSFAPAGVAHTSVTRPVRGLRDPACPDVIRSAYEQLEQAMARRRIGQEQLWGERAARSIGPSLDEVSALVDWAEHDELLSSISSSSKGEPGWPPLALFRVLLPATRHDLSDVRLAEALDDRTSFVRFRGELVRRGLDRALFSRSVVASTHTINRCRRVTRTSRNMASIMRLASPCAARGMGRRRPIIQSAAAKSAWVAPLKVERCLSETTLDSSPASARPARRASRSVASVTRWLSVTASGRERWTGLPPEAPTDIMPVRRPIQSWQRSARAREACP